MLTILKIVFSVLIFGMLVLIHELGHFSMAKAVGVKVNEFSFGMGPRLYTYHGKDTDYSLKLIPFGGSCALKGELEDESGDTDSFVNKKPWQKFLVVAAGPVFNFILAFFAAFILVACVGSDKPVVQSLKTGYPAEKAGIKSGDSIVKINSRNIKLFREVQIYLMLHQDEKLKVTVSRADGKHICEVIPKFSEEDNRYLIGITSSGKFEVPESMAETVKYACSEVRYNILSTIDSLIYMIKGRFSAKDVIGPVGIVSEISATVEETYEYGIKTVLLTMLDYLLLFSANLGVMNLIPFPALDGGRLIFIIWEWISGRRSDQKLESYVNLVGFGLLMAFMIFVMYNDIIRIAG